MCSKKVRHKKVGHFAFRSCPTYCICKPLFLLHICSKSSTFAGLFAKGHFSSLPIVLSFSSLPLPLSCSCQWSGKYFVYCPDLGDLRGPREILISGVLFPRAYSCLYTLHPTLYTLHFTLYSTGRLDARTARCSGSCRCCPLARGLKRSPRSTRRSGRNGANSTSSSRRYLRRVTHFRRGSPLREGRYYYRCSYLSLCSRSLHSE